MDDLAFKIGLEYVHGDAELAGRFRDMLIVVGRRIAPVDFLLRLFRRGFDVADSRPQN